MLTVDRIRNAWKAIIESLVMDVEFISVWSWPLDDKQEVKYPAALWRPIITSEIITEAFGFQDLFEVNITFADQTASDREAAERDSAHDRMETIAKVCWQRFATLYILNSATFQGVTFDFAQDPVVRFMPMWDTAGKHKTGVTMSVTLRSQSPAICLDDYFVSAA